MIAGGRARWSVLVLALAVSVGAALYVSQEAPQPVAAAQAAPWRASITPVIVREVAPAWRPTPSQAHPPLEIFSPPAEQNSSAEPAAPAAPQVPALSVIGAMRDGDQIVVFLSDGQNGHAVGEGDTVNARYRVQAIRPSAITLLDLRTRRQMKLKIGELP